MPILTSLEKVTVDIPSENNVSLAVCTIQGLQHYFAALKQEDPVKIFNNGLNVHLCQVFKALKLINLIKYKIYVAVNVRDTRFFSSASCARLV